MIREFLEFIGVYSIYQRWLKETISHGEVPKHIGVITDGNRRWARERSMEGWEGHWEGAKTLEQFLEWCVELGIKTVTIYSFSTENFNRSQEELDELFNVFRENLRRVLNTSNIHDSKVRVKALGRIRDLPVDIQELIHEVEDVTAEYNDFYLNVAVAYGGRAEIVDATRVIAAKIQNGILEPDDIDERVFEAHLYTSHLPYPDPDIIIRTSGESRLSNFLVWQSAYSELFLLDVYWPSFRKIDLMRAIRGYQRRHRRFGK